VSVLAFAWRNLWRNRRRTAITIGAVVLSTFVLVVGQALMVGLLAGAVRNATDLSVGEVQIHAPRYLRERSFYDAIEDPAAVLRRLQAAGLAAAERSYGQGLAAAGTRSAGALFWGIDPTRERAVFELARHVERGTFLGPAPAGGVVLGRKLARSLGVDVGDEVIAIVQAADGSLGNEIYRVTGILKAVGDTIDRSAALLHQADFASLFVSGGRIHEIAVAGRDAESAATLRVIAASAAPGADVRTWRKLLPLVADMLNMMDASLWIFGTIFFLASGLGVLNTMLMATHERTHEFGVLKAIGTSPGRIVRDVAVEALLLGIVGTLVGAALAAAASLWLEHHGIDTRRFAGETSFAGVAFDPVWRAALGPDSLVAPVAILWATCVLAALYPAILAARLDPVEAMRRP
jgi:ABC-type lipoprotein release transport system permease subunit